MGTWSLLCFKCNNFHLAAGTVGKKKKKGKKKNDIAIERMTNWLEPARSKMAEDSNLDLEPLYTHCNTSAC